MTNIIRKLAILQLVVIILTIVATFTTEPYLPIKLQMYLANELEMLSLFQTLVLIVLLIVMIFYLVSVVGLIFTKLWARKLFIVTTFIIFPLSLFIGPVVEHAITYTLDQLVTLIQGMIFGLLLFTSTYQDSIHNKNNP
jgi:uncharacterized membrane protein YcgQ (UPF0703/DUF1980 family)